MTPVARTHAPRHAGFTLIELLIALAITGMLLLLALPSYQSHLLRARRADALVSMMQIQLAQARWRANSDRYASLAEIGVGSLSGSGYYELASTSESPFDYAATATATGTQAADADCRVFRLVASGADFLRRSGPDPSTANDAAANRRCWGA